MRSNPGPLKSTSLNRVHSCIHGAKIIQHWKGEGRGAGCYNALGKLIKEKKIKKQKLKGQKGSLYMAG